MSKILGVLLTIFLFACKDVKKNDAHQSKDFAKIPSATLQRPNFQSLSEAIEEKEILRFWAAEESYYPTLHFDSKDTLQLEFNGQCEYRFPFIATNDSIVVYWDLIENCTHDIGIKKSFGLKDKPEKGKPFMALRLLNDTTLKATYLYGEWVNRFNRLYKNCKYLPEIFLSVGH